jgi:CRISPR system Cascade subunit CasD
VPVYLVFRLYGPLASWGEIAVGEARHSASQPSRSALLGLCAAALGIERGEEQKQAELSRSFRFGIKLELPGHPLRDFHTIQAPSARRGVRLRTRRQELAAQPLNTLLSYREYRTDSLAVIAAETTPDSDSAWSLEDLARALRQPVFPLYLGRKSCPPALPLSPQIVETSGLKHALDSPQRSLAALGTRNPEQDWPAKVDDFALRPRETRYFWEEGMVPAIDSNLKPALEFTRNDQPLSRARWQFAPRREWVHLSKGKQP